VLRRPARLLSSILAAVLLGALALVQGVVTASPAAAVAPTGFTINSNGSSSVRGQSVTFTASLSGPSGTPTGTVGFTVDSNSLCASVLLQSVSGVAFAQCQTSTLAVGSHDIAATYSGDSTYDADSSDLHGTSLTFAVAKADTSTSTDSTPNPSVYSAPATLGTTVAVHAPGHGTPTGTVAYTANGDPLAGCTAQPLSGGTTASCTASALPVGTTTFSAAYSGDASFNGSTSAPDTQTVTKADSTTTVTGAPNPSTHAQDVIYTATLSAVSPATATPGSGTVDFKANDTPISGCQDVAVTTGQAQCTTGLSPTGSPQITAEYSGDGNFLASVSPPYFQVVNQAATSTALGGSPNPAVYSQPATLTATVTSDGGTPDGTVQFKDGSATIAGCGTRTLSAGVATCSPSLAVAIHSLTAVYSGSADFQASISTALGFTVDQADTTTTVASSDTTSTFGDDVTFTATVAADSPATGTPNAGTVEFTMNGDPISGCTAQPVAAGAATCETATLPVGTHTIAANYSGTASFTAGGSSAISQTVAQASSSTAVSSGANPSVLSQPVTFTATVTSSAVTNPSGTVEFKAGSSTITGCAAKVLSAGTATCTTSALPVGGTAITATYSGSTSVAGSTSTTPLTQTVTKALTLTTLGSNDPTTDWHQPVTFTASVAPKSPATATPSGGTVSFNIGGTAITGCASRPVTSGTATCTTDTLPIGPSSVTAVYSGNPDYLGSTSSSFSQTVNPAPTVTVLHSSEPNARYGQPVTFSAEVTSAAGTPTGALSFYVEQRDHTRALLATKPLDGDGKASTTTSGLPVRTGTPIIAEYAGTTTFATSSDTVNQTVNRSFSRTLLTSSANPSKYGHVVTLSVEVHAMAPGGGQPSGKVAFYRTHDGRRSWIGTAPLVDGTTTLRTSRSPIGVSTIIAEYNGGPNHRESSRSIQHRVKA
jgi:large repetitive protein